MVGNIEIDINETGCEVVDWTDKAQDRDLWQALVNIVLNLQVPYNAGN
jgi:hypothetical protein